MSIKSYLQTVESVLENERKRRRKLIVFRPGARRGYGEIEREIELPNMGAAAFSVALGAVMTGMHAVLDLREDIECAEWLKEALFRLPENACPAITVLIGAQEAAMLGAVRDVQRLCPKTPRQAAGFLRAALHCEGMTMVVLDEEYSDIMDDVPDEDSFVLLPAEEADQEDWEDIVEAPQEDAEPDAQQMYFEEDAADMSESAEQEAVCPQDTETKEETEQGENQFMQQSENIRPRQTGMSMCASRMVSYDPAKLDALCAELNAPMNALVEKCVLRVYERFPDFECRFEEDALDGECAFLPPEQENAAVWIGRDALSIVYDAEKVSHDAAARRLRDIRRLLNKPALLIYDGEENV